MRNQTQQKPIIKRLNIVWRAVGIMWVVWFAIGQVSDMLFLNPSYYWIHEMIFRRWSDVGYILLAVTVAISILTGGLMMLSRKHTAPKAEEAQQKLPKLKEGETMLDYFHRIQSAKNKGNQNQQ